MRSGPNHDPVGAPKDSHGQSVKANDRSARVKAWLLEALSAFGNLAFELSVLYLPYIIAIVILMFTLDFVIVFDWYGD